MFLATKFPFLCVERDVSPFRYRLFPQQALLYEKSDVPFFGVFNENVLDVPEVVGPTETKLNVTFDQKMIAT